MHNLNSTVFFALLAIAVQPNIASVVAQDKQQGESTSQDHPAAKLFEQFSKQVEDLKIKDAVQLMTKGAADEFAAKMVIRGGSYLQPSFSARFPNRKQVVELMEKEFQKHQLTELLPEISQIPKLRTTIHELTLSGDTSDNFKTAKAIHKKILTALDKNGNRWQIVKDIRSTILKDTGELILFYQSKMKTVEIEGDKAFVKVTPGMKNFDNPAFSQAFMPPAVVRLVKENKNWKYDGADSMKTKETIKKSPLFKLNSRR